jgi:hypothetical protein
MLEADPGQSSDLVYTSPTSSVPSWHELQQCDDDDEEDEVVIEETAEDEVEGCQEMVVMFPDHIGEMRGNIIDPDRSEETYDSGESILHTREPRW